MNVMGFNVRTINGAGVLATLAALVFGLVAGCWSHQANSRQPQATPSTRAFAEPQLVKEYFSQAHTLVRAALEHIAIDSLAAAHEMPTLRLKGNPLEAPQSCETSNDILLEYQISSLPDGAMHRLRVSRRAGLGPDQAATMICLVASVAGYQPPDEIRMIDPFTYEAAWSDHHDSKRHSSRQQQNNLTSPEAAFSLAATRAKAVLIREATTP